MDKIADLKRIQWHSRRGMLELDLLLVPFSMEKLPDLNADDVRIYKKLLEQEDQDLFSWLINKETVSDPELEKMVGMVLDREL
jgi:antitoxin CptB